MPQIDLRDLPDSLFFASLPKSVRHSFLNSLRQGFPLVLLHPTRAGCLKCSFGSPLYWFSSWEWHPSAGRAGGGDRRDHSFGAAPVGGVSDCDRCPGSGQSVGERRPDALRRPVIRATLPANLAMVGPLLKTVVQR